MFKTEVLFILGEFYARQVNLTYLIVFTAKKKCSDALNIITGPYLFNMPLTKLLFELREALCIYYWSV